MDNQIPDIQKLSGTLLPSAQFLDSCLEAYEQMGSASEFDKLISSFVNNLANIYKVNKVSFMLFDESNDELVMKAFLGLNPEVASIRVKRGELFSGWVAKEGKPLLVKDIETEFPDLPRARLSRYSTKSFIIVPVKYKDKVVAVVSLTDKKEDSVFAEQDLKMLVLLSDYLAISSENCRLLERNKNLVTLDPLTNLFNHRHFREQLQEEIYRAERYRRPLTVMLLDIDKFSDYNQAHGYSAGDSVLRQTGKLIKENIRFTDSLARYGLDEFGIILPETKLKEALFVAEKVREKISLAVFTEDEKRKSSLGMSRLTASIGIAEHKIGLNEEELVRHAVSALKEAQQKGRNCVCVFK